MHPLFKQLHYRHTGVFGAVHCAVGHLAHMPENIRLRAQFTRARVLRLDESRPHQSTVDLRVPWVHRRQHCSVCSALLLRCNELRHLPEKEATAVREQEAGHHNENEDTTACPAIGQDITISEAP